MAATRDVLSNGVPLFSVPFFVFPFKKKIGTSPAEEKKEREEKKMTLFRKLSFRPTVEELKARKVKLYSIHINDSRLVAQRCVVF
jgi:hypothetical protein